MDHDFSLVELTDDDVPAVVELCRVALDLPEDAAEAHAIVARLRDTTALPAAGAALPAAGVGLADAGAGLPAAGAGLADAVASLPEVGAAASPPEVRGGPPDAGAGRPDAGAGRPDAGAGRPITGLIAVAAGAVVAVALGSIAHRDPSVGHVDLIAVRPDWRRRGVGRALLTGLEAALAGLGATEVLLAGNAPHYVWPGIDVRYTPAICAALALGYEQDRTAWNMTADLSYDGSPALRDTTAAEERLAAAGIAVRRAGPADVAAVVEFARVNFGAAWGGEVTDSIGRTGAGCHIAVRPGAGGPGTGAATGGEAPTTGGTDEILGFAAYGSSRPSWFGPMGTSPAAQGLGIGGVLLRRCLRDQRTDGHRRAEIGWVGPVPFYAGSAGARIERVFSLYRKRL